MTTTGPQFLRVIFGGIAFVFSSTVSRVFAVELARDRANRVRAQQDVTGLLLRQERLQVAKEELRVDRIAVDALRDRRDVAADAHGRTTTTSLTFAYGCAARARSIALATFAAARIVGSASNTKRPYSTCSGTENVSRIAATASAGARPPTGTPPTATPSGRGCGVVAVVVVVVVVGAGRWVVGERERGKDTRDGAGAEQ